MDTTLIDTFNTYGVDWLVENYQYTHMLTWTEKKPIASTAIAKRIADIIFEPLKENHNLKFGALMFMWNQKRNIAHTTNWRFDHSHVLINYPFPNSTQFTEHVKMLLGGRNTRDIKTVPYKRGMARYMLEHNSDLVNGYGQIECYRVNLMKEHMHPLLIHCNYETT